MLFKLYHYPFFEEIDFPELWKSNCPTAQTLNGAASFDWRSTHDKPRGRARTASEGVTGDQRERIVGSWRKQRSILGTNHADRVHRISPRLQSAVMAVEPLDLNRITLGDPLQRPKPTGAMTGEHEISWSAHGSAVEQVRGTEGQRSRGRALQNDFVIAQARDANARNRVRIRPGPRGARPARLHALVPGAADQDACQFGFGVHVQGSTGEAGARDQEQRAQETKDFHSKPPFLVLRASHTAISPASRSAMPRVSRKASAVPVAGAPKTLSMCQPAGSSPGTADLPDWP